MQTARQLISNSAWNAAFLAYPIFSVLEEAAASMTTKPRTQHRILFATEKVWIFIFTLIATHWIQISFHCSKFTSIGKNSCWRSAAIESKRASNMRPMEKGNSFEYIKWHVNVSDFRPVRKTLLESLRCDAQVWLQLDHTELLAAAAAAAAAHGYRHILPIGFILTWIYTRNLQQLSPTTMD